VTTIYLARHAESDWNAENRFQGHTDRPLTERGREQAEALADELAAEPLDAVFSSPLRRAFETAELVAARHDLQAIPVDGLREVDVGDWAGLSRSEVEARFPDAFGRWLAGGEGWQNGETYDEMSERALAAVREITAQHPDGTVLIVSHGGPIRALHAAARNMTVHDHRRLHRVEPNARLSALAVKDGRLTRLD
jgi:broad specificity phosphatase PhoE